MIRRARILTIAAASALLVLPAAYSQANQATPLQGGDALSWNLDTGPNARALVLSVSHPDGVVTSHEFGAGDTVQFSLYREGQTLPDGIYVYEIREQIRGTLERSADDHGPRSLPRGQLWTGAFRVVDGSFFVPREENEPGSGGMTSKPMPGMTNVTAAATVLTTNDGVIRQSLCVGIDCPNSPVFGFDTIRVQENNTRFHFDDTSNTGSFPNNDWRLVANDSANGGRNVFYLEDSSAGREVFSVEAGAPSNALWVDSTGNVGFGTSTPALQLHVKDGNTPALRLEQDNSSGFTAQTYDIAANEANFFIRDVTTGSKLPFRLRPGAPTSSIDVASNGDVGLGTSSPAVPLHVLRSTGADATLFRLTNNGGVRFDFENTVAGNGGNWQFINTSNVGGADLVIRETVANGTEELRLTETGNLTISGALTVGPGGCSGCDLVFSPGYQIESIEDHAAYMWQNRHLPGVGPTPEDEPMNLSQKTGGILNELEKAHIYITHLHADKQSLEIQQSELRAELSELKALVEKLLDDE